MAGTMVTTNRLLKPSKKYFKSNTALNKKILAVLLAMVAIFIMESVYN
jgi:inner membrane protein involved in colicin E2 resistance